MAPESLTKTSYFMRRQSNAAPTPLSFAPIMTTFIIYLTLRVKMVITAKMMDTIQNRVTILAS